ncbi:PREDICTED: YDG domain-containing protein At5g47150-like [Tarenaya hassleriana]|uniref:YDG domain-containing protein At5g47150-like n=1 Tax=Tarenaya hassleriana TaxID=28532 RepID=UPI00053C42AF|nr:PREDICTED: YDG domain-containing protein At5g47150-like [Tarenaya hassleriana]
MATKRSCSSELFSGSKRISAVRDAPVGCGPQTVGFGLAKNDPRIGNARDYAATACRNVVGPVLKKVKLKGLGSSSSAEVGLVETVGGHSCASLVDGSQGMELIGLHSSKSGSKGMLLSAKGNSSEASFRVRKGDYSRPSSMKNANPSHRKIVSATRTFPPFCGNNAQRLSRPKTVGPVPSQRRLPPGPRSEMSCPREKVRKTLSLFQEVFKQLSLEKHEKRENATDMTRRMDCRAWKVMKEGGKHVNRGKIIGEVAGIEVGDKFGYKAELSVVGLHHSMRGGIDSVIRGEVRLATSIVSTSGGSHNDEMVEKDVVVYTGQGGNVERMNRRAEDQKLVRGNLALANCFRYKTPVRLIRGEARAGGGKVYVYDGLYLVEEFWREVGPRGKLVFKFKLRRQAGQTELRLTSNV